jgi:hypothetical protein
MSLNLICVIKELKLAKFDEFSFPKNQLIQFLIHLLQKF